MAMGSTGIVNMSPDMLKNAQRIIEEYKTTVEGLAVEVDEAMTALIPGQFSGSAADGMTHFYENEVVPSITTNLNELLDNLHRIAGAILAAIPDVQGVDDQLGEENRNAVKED